MQAFCMYSSSLCYVLSYSFIYVILVLGYTQVCSRVTPGSEVRNYSWWFQETIQDAGDLVWVNLSKENALLAVLLFWHLCYQFKQSLQSLTTYSVAIPVLLFGGRGTPCGTQGLLLAGVGDNIGCKRSKLGLLHTRQTPFHCVIIPVPFTVFF